jgi:hypothetical protein
MHVGHVFGCLTVLALVLVLAQPGPAQSDWQELKPSVSPRARGWHAMVHDFARARTVMFGGSGLGAAVAPQQDTHEWDGVTWHNVSTSQGPKWRTSHALAYEFARRRTLLFGGQFNDTYLGDTWAWDGQTWSELNPPNAPGARSGHAMVYDSLREVVVLFGGHAGPGTPFTDTWEWNGSTWTRMSPPRSPTIFVVAMTYDRAHRRTLLFGERPARLIAAVVMENRIACRWGLRRRPWTLWALLIRAIRFAY